MFRESGVHSEDGINQFSYYNYHLIIINHAEGKREKINRNFLIKVI